MRPERAREALGWEPQHVFVQKSSWQDVGMSQATAAPTDLYSIPQQHQDFRDLVRQIAQEQVAPRAAEIDQTDEYPWDIRKLLGEQDILGLPFAEEHGGTGTGTLMLQMAVEELAKASAAVVLILMVQELGTLPIQLFVPLMTQSEPSCFAVVRMSAAAEPASGSERQNAGDFSPVAQAGRKRSFISSEPKS